jgi:Bacteriophage tail sheath protein
MPATLTYPGVYVEEIPSGVRTITGVATSVAAFIGRARRGPIDEPRTINSYADFERIYGGLWDKSSLGYAVRDFYLNGGRQAIVVRLYHADSGGAAKPARATLDAKGLALEAAYPGSWANGLRARVDLDVVASVADELGVAKTDLFNLTVRDSKTGDTEQFRNLTVKESSRRADRVLTGESRLVRVKGDLPGNPPTAHKASPAAGKTIWEDDETSTGVADAAQASDGEAIAESDFTGDGKQAAKDGLFALEETDLFNLLCIPPYTAGGDVDSSLVGTAAKYCEDRRALLFVDPPSSWKDKDAAKSNVGNVGTSSKNAALFFPRLRQRDPERGNQVGDFVPCGAVAGVFARTDTERGVWKAPAGLAAILVNVPELAVTLTDDENGELNPLGINCLRSMPPAGRVLWGSRTLQGDDRLASEWKYVPVRRTALFIEESLYRGTQWVVFEPNDEPLWASIRLNVGAFMHNLFRQGAFQGKTPQEAYFVKCDKETTTQNDIDLGIVNIVVGFAPLKPAEFVVIKIQQIAGQVEA